MTNEINYEKYIKTMTSGMTDVTEAAEPVVDIWPYVKVLAKENIISNYVLENSLVEKVYRSKYYKYDHVLLPIAGKNQLVVPVI